MTSLPNDVRITCLSIDCPERSGGRCQGYSLLEREGELSTLKLMLHWATLHDIQDVKDYAEHAIASLEQVPDQPLASDTLKAISDISRTK